MNARASAEDVRAWLAAVPDPEIPVLSITDLGIVRDISVGEEVVVGLAPTYSACPATEAIEAGVRARLREKGIVRARIERRLSPPWTTDWITADGRRKLAAYGIAPPAGLAAGRERGAGDRPAACPQCGSTDTERVSEFGSTPCKAAWRCRACLEPFDYFKCL
ncbi:MAG TPA: 1,2-phenylacetyl-CoA epoxidase subunit PaaD [Woeseiaceae bacterium]|nr:1,2-phenylacetyl-CoA epoxidase subunit PaaD [Woeseiaceae bacterium]